MCSSVWGSDTLGWAWIRSNYGRKQKGERQDYPSGSTWSPGIGVECKERPLQLVGYRAGDETWGHGKMEREVNKSGLCFARKRLLKLGAGIK